MNERMVELINMSRKGKLQGGFAEWTSALYGSNDKTSHSLSFKHLSQWQTGAIDSMPPKICELMLEMPHNPHN